MASHKDNHSPHDPQTETMQTHSNTPTPEKKSTLHAVGKSAISDASACLEQGVKAQREFSPFEFLVFVVSVGILSVLSFYWMTSRFGDTEARDRNVFLSLILIAEVSVWVARGVQRLATGRIMPTSLARIAAYIPRSVIICLAVIICCCAFPINSFSPITCFIPLCAALTYEFVRSKIKILRYLEVIELPLACAVLWYATSLMVMTSSKDPHHWGYFLGPVYAVIEGGKLLWDTPSQYGFLNILSIAALAELFGVDPIKPMSYVVLGLQVFGAILSFLVFRFRLKFSTIVSSLGAASLQFCLPGWIEGFRGPAFSPSVSALRFLPSAAALLAFDLASKQARWRSWILAACLITVSCLWSAESCLYTLAPILAYSLASLLSSQARSKFISHCVPVGMLALFLVASFLFVYSLSLPHGIDFYAFCEYALTYSTSFGLLTIKTEIWTTLLGFIVCTCYLFARTKFTASDSNSAQGIMFFAYLMGLSTYFVARSSYTNIHNIIPWVLLAVGSISLRDGHPLRIAQRTLALSLAMLTLGYFIPIYKNNPQRIADQKLAPTAYILPERLAVFSPDIGEALRSFTRDHRVTVLTERDLVAPSEYLRTFGYALPISPLSHFTILGHDRQRAYLDRMLERLPVSYILCLGKACEGPPYSFQGMKDIIEMKQVPFPPGNGWKLLEVRRPQTIPPT